MILQSRWSALFLAGFGLSLATAASADQRSDLYQAWHARLCGDAVPTRPAALWQEGFFDAQVEGRLFETGPGVKIADEDIARKSRSMSKALRHQGYAFGRCKNGNAWTVSTPAPKALVRKNATYHLPRTELESSCREWTVSFVAAKGGAAQPLAETETINTAKLGNGVLSVECLPQRPRWLGKQLWYLAPVGKGPDEAVPHSHTLSAENREQGMLNWINAVRRDAGLRTVFFREELNQAAGVLAISQQVSHDRDLLGRTARELEAKHLKLLGEDRVAAGSLSEAAWLLWNSPSHRDLLLNPDAAFLGVSLTSTGPELFAVVTMGAPRVLNTATAPQTKEIKAN